MTMKRPVTFLLKLFMSGILLAATATAQTESGWKIDTIAGTGKPGHGGDGSLAVQTPLEVPVGVAVDKSGNIFISEHYGQRIRRVDSSGTIDTIAGIGEPSYGGDGGPAVEARFSFPSGVAVDPFGNLFIADTGNNRIRRVDGAGTITTVAGSGEWRWGTEGRAVEVPMERPRSIAVDTSGNLYIVALGASGIRRVDVTGNMKWVPGSSDDKGPEGEHRPSRDRALAVDHTGNVYIANIDHNYVRRVDDTGLVSVFAGTRKRGYGGDGGPATEAQLNYPLGLAVDKSRSVYIADSGNHRIRRVDPSGTITTIAGTGEPGYGGDGGPAARAQLASPVAVAVDTSGKVYIADLGNSRIRVLTPPPGLNFAHFANGASITSDLVLMNVGTTPIRPTISFYNKEGHPIPAESIVDVGGDLESQQDGAITVRTMMEPLGDLTISTHGRGELVTGSVRVEADGPIGGVLRFDIPAIGVAGVGASHPVHDAIFPARRRAGGINTGAAIRNLEVDPMTLTCQLMRKGAVLEEKEIPLAANGQTAKFIDEMFETDTSDFVGAVRCSAPGEGRFTGVALEMDPGNRIFTTLPLIPVSR